MKPCINRMPGGIIAGDSGLCCCVPVVHVRPIIRANKQWEVIALEQLSHTLNAGPQQQRPKSPTITPHGMR